MTTSVKTRAVSSAAALIVCKGAGKAAREMAFVAIAPYSFSEDQGRQQSINNLRVALGKAPTESEFRVAKQQWMIGRIAARLPAGEFPKGTGDTMDKLEFASDLLLNYASPPKEGTKARKLRHGQKGRRSTIQQRIVRAAEEAWSMVNAELGIKIGGTAPTSTATPQKERDKRKPHRNGKSAKGKAPAHGELVTPPKDMTVDEKHAYVVTQMTNLLAFVNKSSKDIETSFSMPVIACQKALVKADAERRVRLSK